MFTELTEHHDELFCPHKNHYLRKKKRWLFSNFQGSLMLVIEIIAKEGEDWLQPTASFAESLPRCTAEILSRATITRTYYNQGFGFYNPPRKPEHPLPQKT